MKRYLLFLSFACLSLLSCSRVEGPHAGRASSLVFRPGVSSYVESRAGSGLPLRLSGGPAPSGLSVRRETFRRDPLPGVKGKLADGELPGSSSFYCFGYRYSGAWDGTQVPNFFFMKEFVRISDGLWMTPSQDTPYWTSGEERIRFIAVSPGGSPLLSFRSFPSDPGPVRYFYRVSDSVSLQEDLLEAVSDELDGDFGAAVPLIFNHALTGVRVRLRDMHSPCVVRRVLVSGVFSSGLHTVGDGAWTGQDEPAAYEIYRDVPVSGTGDELVVDGTDTLFLIPQTVPDDAFLELLISFGGHYSMVRVDLSGEEWRPGEMVDYVVSFSDDGYVAKSVCVSDVSSLTAPAGSAGRVGVVTSFALDAFGGYSPQPWEVAGFSPDGLSWSADRPAWLASLTSAGEGGRDGEEILAVASSGDGGGRTFVRLRQRDCPDVVTQFEIVRP